jgi:hypothetical protein
MAAVGRDDVALDNGALVAGRTRIERRRHTVEDVSQNLIDALRGEQVVDFPIGASFDHCADISILQPPVSRWIVRHRKNVSGKARPFGC